MKIGLFFILKCVIKLYSIIISAHQFNTKTEQSTIFDRIFRNLFSQISLNKLVSQNSFSKFRNNTAKINSTGYSRGYVN